MVGIVTSPQFDRSLLKVLGRDGSERPWRWTTEPVYGNGPMQPPTVAGVRQEANGVFILLSDELVQMMKDGLTQAQKDQIDGWVDRRNEASCAEWHVPVWAGQDSAVFIRIPAATWDDPTGVPPLIVRTRLKALWQAIQ